ncbi:hypothetical protein [Streptomyces sp. NPDC057460]|uniref:hypothetical protein n=1 Tax=Streptomyces sp. NPDC057460 TaxID=3346141 RepID=UPI0036B12A86
MTGQDSRGALVTGAARNVGAATVRALCGQVSAVAVSPGSTRTAMLVRGRQEKARGESAGR